MKYGDLRVIIVVCVLGFMFLTMYIVHKESREVSYQKYEEIKINIQTDLHRSYVKQFMVDNKISEHEFDKFMRIIKKEREDKSRFKSKQKLINFLREEDKPRNDQS